MLAHVFILLTLVEHDCFRKTTQYIDPRLHHVARSKLPRSLIPIENQLVERSIIDMLEKVKSILLSYDNWMSLKTEEISSLTAHYCTGPERNNTHIGVLFTTATDGFSLYFSIMELVENSGLEANIVGITNDGGGNLRFFREAMESKYTNDSIFFSPNPLFTMN